MAKIYVSSTFLDLQDYRAQVERVIRRMGHEDVAMEYYVASDERPVEKCLADVAACDIYIGVYAWRYGWQPTENNPQKISITEMEYRQAEKLNKSCFIFVLSDEQPWARKFIDKDTTQIEKLRNDASEKHSSNPFTTPDDLARKVAEAIHAWEKEHGYLSTGANIPQFDREAYFNAMRRRYGVIALEGLTPPQREEYLQIQLRSVFVEQDVRENPPPVELPKEVWAKLEREKEIRADDLPKGVTIYDIRRAREAYFEKPSRLVLDVLTDATANRVLILGDPGSGKSTLARFVLLSVLDPNGTFHSILDATREAMVAEGELDSDGGRQTTDGGPSSVVRRRLTWAKQFENYLPLLIELRNFVALRAENKCETFFEFLEYLGKTEGWHLNAAALRQYLENDGRAVVVFDGLDEIFDPQLRDHITQQIVAFASDYPKARILVTSRVIGYRRKILTDANFKHFTLQDLNEKQVEAFANRWYGLALADRPDEAKERRERILRAFRESPSIRQLAGNPMLLTIMAIIGKHQELPRERWKLYDHAASVLIQHWDVNKHLQDKRIQADFIGENDKKELLRRLAYRMQSGEGGLAGNYIHRDELEAEFEVYLKERYNQSPADATKIARAMIEQFRERNFILSLYGANLYGFVHRAFLEYFCAWAFVWKFEKTQELSLERLKVHAYKKHWKDQNWHEVLRLICGMVDEKWAGDVAIYLLTQVLVARAQQPTKKKLPWNIALALDCMSEIQSLSAIPEASKTTLTSLCSLFELAQRNPTLQDFVQKRCLPAVERIGSSWPSDESLTKWLTGHEPFLYSTFKYVELFGEFVGFSGKGSEPIKRILLTYGQHKSFLMRALVPFTLAVGWQNAQDTLPFVIGTAVNDASDWVRLVSMYALGIHYKDNAEVSAFLIRRAKEDPDGGVRRAALVNLNESFLCEPARRDFIVEIAKKDRDGQVRRAALSRLRKVLERTDYGQRLLMDTAAHDPDAQTRKLALAILGEDFSSDPSLLQFLCERIYKDRRGEVRFSIMQLLYRKYRDQKQVYEVLVDRATNDGNSNVRILAIQWLNYLYRNDKETVDILKQASMSDQSKKVRYEAHRLLLPSIFDFWELFAKTRVDF